MSRPAPFRAPVAATALVLALAALVACSPGDQANSASSESQPASAPAPRGEPAMSTPAPVPGPRLMTINGEGFVMAKPDMASLSVGVIAQGKTAAEASEENTRRMATLFAALKELGIQDADIQTTNYYVGPRYALPDPARPGGESQIVGYDVTNTVTVKVRDLKKLGAAIDRFVGVAQGANSLSGLSFEFANPEPLMDEARKKAVGDAKRKAELYASAAGLTLGPIQAISEAGAYTPMPMFVRAEMSMAKAAADVPISQGENRVSANVSITWELR